MTRFSALLIATAALIGCNQTENTPHDHETHSHTDGPRMEPAGKVIKEFELNQETSVRFQETDGAITLSLEGHLDERDANSVLEEKLFQARTMEAAYRVMDPEGAVPQAILDFDKRSKELAETTAPGVLETTGPGAALPSGINSPLAKKSDHAYPGSDANWDWTADANWWKDVVGYKCGWHEALHYTNFTWVDDWRQGWYSRGYLMAASHTYGANAYAYIWRNGAWSQTNSMYLQPRHYVVWYSGDASKQYRRYRVVGNGGNYARTHWGMRWDSQAPSDVGVICQY